MIEEQKLLWQTIKGNVNDKDGDITTTTKGENKETSKNSHKDV